LSLTAAVSGVVQPLFNNDTQQNFFLQNVVIERDGPGNSKNIGAMVDIFATGDQTLIDNVHIDPFDGIGLRINVRERCSRVLLGGAEKYLDRRSAKHISGTSIT